MKKLNCRGIGVVIDDKVPFTDEDCLVKIDSNGESGNQVKPNPITLRQDCIVEIVRQIKADRISLLRYRELPPPDEWENFDNVAFLLIDWALINPDAALEEEEEDNDDSSSDVDVGHDPMEQRICDFIKSVHSRAFAPVFVFSNQDDGEIKACLRDNDIETDVPGAYVLVKPKEEMVKLDEEGTPKLFNEINNWIRATPTIHLLTTWGRDVLTARNQMFAEFYDKNHNWPSLLWKTYKFDHDNPAHGLSQVMFDNLKGRIKCELPEMPEVNQDEKSLKTLNEVLALTVMLPPSSLPQGQIGCGDLFAIEREKYWLVVSCDCDCIVREGKTPDNTLIQVVRVSGGCKPESITMGKRFSPAYGLLHQAHQSYLFPINGKCYCVHYTSFSMISLSQLALDKRIGRVLPPYITDVRQRLAQWNQRVGFPKLPPELFPAAVAKNDKDNGPN